MRTNKQSLYSTICLKGQFKQIISQRSRFVMVSKEEGPNLNEVLMFFTIKLTFFTNHWKREVSIEQENIIFHQQHMTISSMWNKNLPESMTPNVSQVPQDFKSKFSCWGLILKKFVQVQSKLVGQKYYQAVCRLAVWIICVSVVY